MESFYVLIEPFNSRELATIFWVILFAVWSFFQKDVAKSLFGLIKAAAGLWKFFLILFLYIGLSIYLLHELNIWNIKLLKVTIYWIFGWSLIAFMSTPNIKDKKEYFKKVLKDSINLTVLIAFFVSLYVFPFWFEFFLVPFAVLLGLLALVSGMKEEYKGVKGIFENAQVTFGTAIMVFCLYEAFVDIGTLANFTNLTELLLPIVLSLMLLPLLYALSWYGQYEQRKIREKYLSKS